jgi:hypothetical protein
VLAVVGLRFHARPEIGRLGATLATASGRALMARVPPRVKVVAFTAYGGLGPTPGAYGWSGVRSAQDERKRKLQDKWLSE